MKNFLLLASELPMNDKWILGINALGNMPSACLIKNGEIVAMAEEERFSRKKVSFGAIPINSVKFCLQEGKISLDDVSEVSFAWDCNYYLFGMPAFLIVHFFKSFKSLTIKGGQSNILRALKELYWYNPFRVKSVLYRSFKEHLSFTKKPKIRFINHHLSHALSTYFASGFETAAILVIDGCGESTATSIWRAEKNTVQLFKKWSIPNSIGWFYGMITEFLGYSTNRHEGKVMALAAYGRDNKELRKKIQKILSPKDNGYFFDSRYSISGSREQDSFCSADLYRLLGSPRLKSDGIEPYHQDIAFHAQQALEETVASIIEQLQSEPWFKGNICIAGGVGLNCKMNGMISTLSGVKDIYVPPFSNDAGSAYGAALDSYFKFNLDRPVPLAHAYWGPSFTNHQIEDALKQSSVSYKKFDNVEEIAAQLLFENKILGWFQGKMEVGARALGNRSILANPTIYDNKDFINKRIKNREEWRPFAASILYERRHDFFDTDIDSPYMALAFPVKEINLHKIPAAVHIDGTTRPQLVRKEVNERYWKLINNFGKLSGTYALLNTSFNLKEEPIVCTPQDAVRTFKNSNIDYLVMGDYIIGDW